MPTQTSPAGIALIKQFESCKLKAYPDPGTGGKPWTIGWGATTDFNGQPIVPGTEWTQEHADLKLAQDLSGREAKLIILLNGAPTTQHQFDALMSLGYNIGMPALGKSTLLRCHKAGEYNRAKAEFAKWNKAGGMILKGLVRRRAAEAELYSS